MCRVPSGENRSCNNFKRQLTLFLDVLKNSTAQLDESWRAVANFDDRGRSYTQCLIRSHKDLPESITNRRCFPRFCKQDTERVLVATSLAVYSYCLHLNSICREYDESLLVRRGTEYFSGRFSLWFSLSFAKRQLNYWKQFLTGRPFCDELSTGRVYFKHCFRHTEMRAFRKRLLLFLVTLAFKVSICNLSDPTILTFLWSTGGRLYIVFDMNKIVDRNCQFHANFYCYSFLCIQYQILSSETTNIIGSLYLAPGTQHCLQEKSTCLLLLTEHLKLCDREHRQRYHNMIHNYIYNHFSIIFVIIIVITFFINSSSIVISISCINIIIIAIVIVIIIIIITLYY